VTEVEKLRSLLAEARDEADSFMERIDAALAEPVGVGMDPPTYACLDCGHCMHGITFTWQEGERPRSMCLKCRRNRVDAIELAVERLVRERDEARAEVERAYQRGAEAMREAADQAMSQMAEDAAAEFNMDWANRFLGIGDIIRALPLPEEKP